MEIMCCKSIWVFYEYVVSCRWGIFGTLFVSIDNSNNNTCVRGENWQIYLTAQVNTRVLSCPAIPRHQSIQLSCYIVIICFYRKRRSEEHTSELQSRGQLVCRLLLEKKNNGETRQR